MQCLNYHLSRQCNCHYPLEICMGSKGKIEIFYPNQENLLNKPSELISKYRIVSKTYFQITNVALRHLLKSQQDILNLYLISQ